MKRLKGSPRTRNEQERRLRAALHRLTPKRAADFLRCLPAESRSATLRVLRDATE